MKNGIWENGVDGPLLRAAREERSLTRATTAEKLGVSAPSIYNWETGKVDPQPENLKAIIKEFGEKAFVVTPSTILPPLGASFGTWTLEQRTKKKWSRAELSKRSGLSQMTIWNIETGRTTSPQHSTQEALENAFGEQIPEDVEADIAEEAQITVEGVKSGGAGDLLLLNFDPHDEKTLPRVPGIYVFYDIAERAIYVGESDDIGQRIRDDHTGHWNKFWYRAPIVQSGSFVRVDDSKLRKQVEAILIKFLKSNAVLNQQLVDR